MEDLILCPICGNILRTAHLNKFHLHIVGKTANYAERTCPGAHGHSIMFWTDKTTNQIDFLKVSLNCNYSRFVEIDFLNKETRVLCSRNGKFDVINVGRLLIPDFPDLSELRKSAAFCVTMF